MQDVLDEYKKKHKTEDILYDGVHPSELEHQIITDKIAEILNL